MRKGAMGVDRIVILILLLLGIILVAAFVLGFRGEGLSIIEQLNESFGDFL